MACSRYKIEKDEVMEIAYLGLDDPAVLSLANKIARAERAIVRFRGRFHRDLAVREAMKSDLKAVLAALVALGLENESMD